MKRSSHLWFLLPHAISVACFIAAFLWMMSIGTNRSTTDLNLAITGSVALVAALISSIAAVIVVIRLGARQHWPWLLAHLGGLVLALVLAVSWMGAHIA